MSTVNRTLFRRSGTLKMFFRLESTQRSLAATSQVRTAAGRRRPGFSTVGELVALHRRAAGSVRQGQHVHGTSGGRDGRFGCLREPVSLDPYSARDLAPPEHLDEGALVGQTVGVEHRRRDLAEVVLGGHCLQGVEVDALVLDAEGVVEALHLRHSLLEGHLATLEAARHRVAGPLALGATAGGLAAVAADAPAYAPLGATGPGGRLQVVDSHVSSPTPPLRR